MIRQSGIYTTVQETLGEEEQLGLQMQMQGMGLSLADELAGATGSPSAGRSLADEFGLDFDVEEELDTEGLDAGTGSERQIPDDLGETNKPAPTCPELTVSPWSSRDCGRH